MSGFYELSLTLFPHICILIPFAHQLWIGKSHHGPALLTFILLVATAVCFPSFSHVSNFSIVPDSVEYASSAHNILSQGTPLISIDGVTYPSRYPFGFSLLVVVPGMIAGNFAQGSEILFITLYSVLGIVGSFVLASTIAGQLAGILSVILLLLLPPYVLSSQELLTYSPSAGLGLLFLFFSYRLLALPHSRTLPIGIASSLLLASACRPLSIFLVIPALVWSFIYNRRNVWTVILSLIPSAILLGSYLVFNYNYFGSPLRSGYSFWSSVPYDFPELLINSSYLKNNAAVFLNALGLIVLVAACGIRFFKRDPLTDLLLLSSILFGLPLCVFHLMYFYPGTFFFLQPGILFIPIVAAMLSRMIAPRLTSHSNSAPASQSFTAALTLLFLVGCLQRFSVYQRVTFPNTRRELVREVSSVVPADSVLISGMDPVSFSLLSHGEKKIKVIPKSRNVEYASKFIAPVKPKDVEAVGWSPQDHRKQALLSAGAKEVLPLTAREDMPSLKNIISQGSSVYFETATKDELTIEALRAHFTVTKVSEHLYLIGTPISE